jgi:BirA family biotin operon repressor/biotin-[acetyl-CoA-carboxylase] ligase
MRIYLEKTTSTNQIAKEKLAELPHGSAIFAEEQTAGRGRFGREFRSPAGTGIYMSIIINCQLSIVNCQLLTPAAAVAVCRAVKARTSKSPQIKWVNDVLLDGRKICGILSESVGAVNNRPNCIIVGIGINFTTDFTDFPELNAASLFPRGETPTCTREELAESVIEELLKLQKEEFMDEYRALSCLIGEEISYMQNNEKHFGTVQGIDDEGRLLVSGKVLCSGEVNLIRKTNQT